MSGCKEVDLLMLSGLQVLVVGLHFCNRMAQSTSETLLRPAQLLDPRPHLAVLIPVVPKLWLGRPRSAATDTPTIRPDNQNFVASAGLFEQFSDVLFGVRQIVCRYSCHQSTQKALPSSYQAVKFLAPMRESHARGSTI